MLNIVLSFILGGLLFGNTIVTIKKNEYTENDFYKDYGKKEWDNSDTNQKKELINDFVHRKIATLEATEIGLQNRPDITKKLYDRYNIALINITYEELIAKPLVSNVLLEKTKKHIIEERLLSHILIGHESARTQTPSDRTIDEALLLAQKISKELKNGENFVDYAIKYSEDPTVFQNEGKLDWITWGRTIPTFQNEAFSLKKGEYSSPILTDFGYHIIFCEDIRPSEYALLSKEEIDEISYVISRNTISNQLPDAAKEYDSMQMENYNLKYNDSALNMVLKSIEQQINKNKVSGQYKLNLVDLFGQLNNVGVVAMFDDKGYGIKWFAERLRMLPTGRHPQIVDLQSLKQAFDIIILQYLAIKEGYKNNVHNTLAYKKQKAQLYQSLLYDQYLRWLVNNADEPDSSDISTYYIKNKKEKYLEAEKISIREIKVLNKALADSILLELRYNGDFLELAGTYSKTNPLDGGLITPFVKGKYNIMGETAFSLNVGEISDVITNLDRSYSIIRVEGLIPEKYIPINKVYNRIDSILKRENQKSAKEDGLKQLKYKYNVIVNI